MTTTEISVLIGGLILIALILYYFFGPKIIYVPNYYRFHQGHALRLLRR